MRQCALLFLAACGGQPALANAPHPSNAAVAGAAAAAAAAITLASPDTATQKPEKNQADQKQAVEVKEHVTPDVLDRLDKAEAGQGSDAEPAKATPAKRKGPPPKLPTPEEAAQRTEPAER